eukprot:scaffold29548_cov78-Skeletonema_dohrnii-CCMP3373.AAC.1
MGELADATSNQISSHATPLTESDTVRVLYLCADCTASGPAEGAISPSVGSPSLDKVSDQSIQNSLSEVNLVIVRRG